MAKISEKYEAMVVFSVSAGEDNVKGLVESSKLLLKTTVQLKKLMNGASVSWLMKLTIRLKGYYVLYTF